MRSKLYTMVRLLGTGSLFVSLSASADTPASRTGAGWDDSHMQSNFSRRLAAPTPQRVVVGTTRFDEGASTPSRVEEQTLAINPHGWTPGGRSSIGATTRPAASNGGFAAGNGARAERGSILRGAVNPTNGSRTSRF
jgi:hypothetical protein